MPRRSGLRPAEQIDHSDLPTVHLSRDYPTSEVDRLVRTGRWARIRRGAYVDAELVARASHPQRLLALARLAALAHQLSVPHVVSHESAALVWGLPTLTVPATSHVIQASWPSAERSDDISRHSHRLNAGDRTMHRGVGVTTLERTAVDCAMSGDPLAGLIVADACLHNGASRATCLAMLDGMAGRRGIRTARAVLSLADDGAESPRETWTRFILVRAGFPPPQTQVQVMTALGPFWSDLGWPEWRLLVEYDGRGKYERGGSTSEVMVQERRRHDAIEEAGWRIVRVTKEDHRDSGTLVGRVARRIPGGGSPLLRPRRDLRRFA